MTFKKLQIMFYDKTVSIVYGIVFDAFLQNCVIIQVCSIFIQKC